MNIKFILPVLITSFFVLPFNTHTRDNNKFSAYSKNKFFVKTKIELKVSEATGKISLTTDINSIDEKIIKYDIVSIENVFKLNNGDAGLYDKFGMSRIYLFRTDENSEFNMDRIGEDFGEDVNIEFCEPDFIGTSAGVKETNMKEFFTNNMPNDVMFSKQWYMQNSGSVQPSSSGGLAKIGADINIVNAWEIQKGSEEVIIAILDSGIKDDHPDLKNRMWVNENEIPGNGIDDDRNGYIDDYKGWDFAYDDKKPDDGFGHGTNIATVIGASTNNMIGFAGIDQNCRLMNCKNLSSDNSGEYGWWAESIKYAVDNGADIINMSEGGDDYSKVLKTAIDYALESGVLINAAMMNKGDNRDYYPASFKGVFAIGATDTDDRRCRKFSWGGGSCWGKHISVVAPGNKIYGLDYESDDNYEVYWSGTSQSTAIVSAISSLLLAQNKTRSAEDLKRIIKLSSRDLVGEPREDKAGWDQYYGYGRVDSYAALSYEDNSSDKKEIETLKENEQPENTDKETDDPYKDKEKLNEEENSDGQPAKARVRDSDDR
ncbi:MAG: S8 family serine peptidase [bacterium]|nr:S8 family serine peptidase [bacterium]